MGKKDGDYQPLPDYDIGNEKAGKNCGNPNSESSGSGQPKHEDVVINIKYGGSKEKSDGVFGSEAQGNLPTEIVIDIASLTRTIAGIVEETSQKNANLNQSTLGGNVAYLRQRENNTNGGEISLAAAPTEGAPNEDSDVDESDKEMLNGFLERKVKLRLDYISAAASADNATTGAITAVGIMVGFMISTNSDLQTITPSLLSACICFIIALLGTLLSCCLANTTIPDVVQCIEEIAKLDQKLGLEVGNLKRCVDPAIEGGTGKRSASFTGKVNDVQEAKILPTRLFWRRIKLLMVFGFGVGAAAVVIFRSYFVALGAHH